MKRASREIEHNFTTQVLSDALTEGSAINQRSVGVFCECNPLTARQCFSS